MKELIVKVIPYDKKMVTLALESGVDAVVVEEKYREEVASLGRIKVMVPEDIRWITLSSPSDEEEAAHLLEREKMVVITLGWEIIPIENLLALSRGRLGVEVSTLEEARLAAGILERGVDALIILPPLMPHIKEVVKEIKISGEKVELSPATITSIRPIGLGHRVCVDTCSLLSTGQGMLVGNSSGFTFLVHAETEENPYVAARPFRINAGALHSYVLRPGDRTSYLEELRAGDEVLVVDASGSSLVCNVGRVKIEIRPLLIISARTEDAQGEVILQNAETIRLVGEEGRPISVVDLQEGDRVLVRVDSAGRHFGMRIQEEIQER